MSDAPMRVFSYFRRGKRAAHMRAARFRSVINLKIQLKIMFRPEIARYV